MRLIDSCITQGPSRTCNESKEEEWGQGHSHWTITPAMMNGVQLKGCRGADESVFFFVITLEPRVE